MKKRKTFLDYSKPEPKGFDAPSRNEVGKRGEKNLQKETGCVLTPGSGCGKIKGDGVLNRKQMLEKKTTEKKSFTVSTAILEKLCAQAFDSGKEPVLVIEFEACRFGNTQWAMIPLERLLELYKIESGGD